MKTTRSALVIVPPPGCWKGIQEIRSRHDRRFRRWMPHITLIYPFRPAEEFAPAEALLREGLRDIEPFSVRLGHFSCFIHAHRITTLYLQPEPQEPLLALHETLLQLFPDCIDTARLPGGFTPHLSVGQTWGRTKAERLRSQLQDTFTPLIFPVRELSLLRRGNPPNDVFLVDRTVTLGQN